MGSLSLRKYVSSDHDKGPRARQLWIHQDIRAVLASRHAGCGGAVPGGARTFHGLCIACAARVDRRLVPETQTSIKPASGSPKTCQEAQCCPCRRWQWWGARSHRDHCCSLPRHHTTPPTDCGPMVHPWETPLCNKSRQFILPRPRNAAAAQRNGPCEMQGSGARTHLRITSPFLGDG